MEVPEKLQLFEVPCPECGEGSFNIILKPGILHRLICPQCKKVFYVKIKKDLGVVVLRLDEYKKVRCSECNGTGKCRYCRGTGRKSWGGVCNECYGTGNCPRCGGEGLILGEEK